MSAATTSYCSIYAYLVCLAKKYCARSAGLTKDNRSLLSPPMHLSMRTPHSCSTGLPISYLNRLTLPTFAKSARAYYDSAIALKP